MSRENAITVTGRLMRAPVEDHETSGGWIWWTEIATARLSGVVDMLQVMIPERVMDDAEIDLGMLPRVKIMGEIRRHMLKELRADGQPRWVPAVYAQRIELAAEGDADKDEVEMWCEVDKHIGHRETPLGRLLTEMRVTMRRMYGHWDSVIVITWGGLARRLRGLKPGARLHVRGRLQSRGYLKEQADGTMRAMVTYEVSAYYVEEIKGGKDCWRAEGVRQEG